MKGWVYVATNPSLPGLLKIGFSDRDPSQRLAELSSSTAIPDPFQCAFAALVEGPFNVEQAVHKLLAAKRHSSTREFFRCAIKEARNAIAEALEENGGRVLYEEGAGIETEAAEDTGADRSELFKESSKTLYGNSLPGTIKNASYFQEQATIAEQRGQLAEALSLYEQAAYLGNWPAAAQMATFETESDDLKSRRRRYTWAVIADLLGAPNNKISDVIASARLSAIDAEKCKDIGRHWIKWSSICGRAVKVRKDLLDDDVLEEKVRGFL